MTIARLPAAVLWDMDGTLVDTEPYWIECEYALVESYGGTWSDELAHAQVGNDLIDTGRAIAEHGGVPLEPIEIVERLLDGVVERVRARLPWRPGARELLEELHARRVPCALVTMSWRRFAEAVVDSVPDRFAALVTGDEVDRPKPYPDPYLVAARMLGQDPARCLAIEDSPKGVASAVAAGVPTLAVQNFVPLSPGHGLTVVDTLEGWTPERLATLLPPPTPGR
ncbi:HAD family hydrolase [Sporichthya polymorpha]|uniref:HAD family hydrolase n=1 Tax=Sporichthya polymorpha TaxID=35751 RepID=UPI000379084F|nr:HAD family phosphatase [Sporichthya polymorpha]